MLQFQPPGVCLHVHHIFYEQSDAADKNVIFDRKNPFHVRHGVNRCMLACLLQVTYTQGATEPGSSGAALIDADTRKVVGILTGGTTTCDVFSGADYFGRLDVVRAPALAP